MAYAEIYKNDDGTKTGFYSDGGKGRNIPYNLMVTVGDEIETTGYKIVVTNVQKSRILVKYVFDNGIIRPGGYSPREFFKSFIRNGNGTSYKPHKA